jgi:membrane-associated phospholipid phosphatase
MLLPLATTLALAGIYVLLLPHDLAGIEALLIFCLALLAAARCLPRLATRLRIAAALTIFSVAILMLIYGLATHSRPWIDSHLAATDAWLGLSAGAVVQWTLDHPLAEELLFVAYCSVIPQTLLAIFVLNDRLETFAQRFMLGALLTAAAFAFVPAQGSCVYFGIPTPEHYAGILDHLDGLRAGRWVLSWHGMHGIVTFPSFHAMWAVFLIAAFRGPLAWIAMPLNGLVIVSTITTGMHYFTDVAVGLSLAGLVVWATRRRRAASEGRIEERQTSHVEASPAA